MSTKNHVFLKKNIKKSRNKIFIKKKIILNIFLFNFNTIYKKK